jgi:hypothetical protein
MFKFSVEISWQNPFLIPTVSESSWIAVSGDGLRGGIVEFFSAYSLVLLVLGCSERLET